MATIDQAIFELQRRAYLWSKNTTLDDAQTAMTWDSDPNDAVTGNSAGETKLVATPVGTQFVQSNGTLWFKKSMPNTWIDMTNQGAKKYYALVGNNSLQSFTITHGLGTNLVLVQVTEVSTGDVVEVGVNIGNGAITVEFGNTPTTDEYLVTIIG